MTAGQAVFQLTGPPSGSITLLVLSFFAGIQLLTLGIMGEYVGRIYMEVKGRPMYIADQRLGLDPPDEKDG